MRTPVVTRVPLTPRGRRTLVVGRAHLVSFALLAFGVGVSASRGAAQRPSPAAEGSRALVTADEPRDRVDLRARLDPSTHRVEGSLTWRFTNRSRRAIEALYWHLYPNAFRAPERGGSVFLREGGTAIRRRALGREGHLELTSLALDDGTDLLARSTLDVGIPDDATQLQTSLPRPLPPGGTLTLRASFVTQLPEAVARSGFAGDFHMVAQWFPKLARLEPNGRWAHFPYHGMGEFYADFADYTLEVRVPVSLTVVAGGDARPAREEGGERVYHFEARAVHDIAFAAAPDLTVLERDAPAARGAVRLRVAHPPGYEHAAQAQLELTTAALQHMASAYGDYPYATLTVVVPPEAAVAVSGMEYPTLFVSSGPWWASARPSFGMGAAETCVHELAHQWFQGLVATDEVRHPALDEGLTSWAAMDFFQTRDGHASGGRVGRVTFDVFEVERSYSLPRVTPRSPLSAASDFDTDAYFRTVYVYVPLALESVARTWGRERLLRALGDYARAGRFQHPGPQELRAAFEREYGAWFVEDVFDAIFTRGCTLHTELSEPVSRCDASGCREELVARRRGCLPLPLQIEITSDEGTRRLPFPADVHELTVVVDPAHVHRVTVDPGRRNLSDPRRLDDVRVFPARASTPPTRGAGLSTRMLSLFQLLLSLGGP
ncbi:MAG: M1 family metallopeptidase [Sandaracinaceae bacterium]|nr:M1 family metallopeptidase [Myxococcales bacterium]MCB9658517.1 M1 family metallopeptidase [Sandaracinaceae bacterium]